MAQTIGKFIEQTDGFEAFVPNKFPPTDLDVLNIETIALLDKANIAIGRLDGIARLLPDVDFFIFMYLRKEAALSSQIEGIQATMSDAIKAEQNILKGVPESVDDIKHYIAAMNFGIKRLDGLPLSLRFIREAHEVLLTEARTEIDAMPGQFRNRQNWIGGATPHKARFVPPPVADMHRSLGDLEAYMHSTGPTPKLIKTALLHAQFETIHPFIDGNGRTGRLLVTFYLLKEQTLRKPVLYLSEYFKRNRDTYFEKLHSYHNDGDIEGWIDFFLEGVCTVAEEALAVSEKITNLRQQDLDSVSKLGRRSEKGVTLLKHLFKLPIVSVRNVEEVTGLSRPAANALVEAFVELGILNQTDETVEYGREFAYTKYLKLFSD